ncbi:aspartate/glutamate racemase family protein [Halococcus sp. IIIV-5B]|uniref:maleate cis-trans isomerase family protein n=1 Tax=Halococcus sp. IIIV-5B TaxID=2321230 RepID=UPI000E71447B|nr:aspartate/glutamate racemase family protein [Halococcus sp. IIIV-5B]RJT03023.1 maleate cis-trans isomerase [Halococcus sp. IIIV-5B]
MTPPDPTADGDRLRLGVVVPSSNTTVEPEFAVWTPAATSIHAARMGLVDVTVEALDAMAADAVAAAERLAHAEVDAVAYACTTGSLLHGHGFDAELEADLAEVTDAPAVATALSVQRLLDALDATRIAVATPYVAELNDREREYLTDAGYDVVALDGRGIERNTDIGRLTPVDALEQATALLDAVEGSPGAVDALFVSCTNYPTLAAVDELTEVPTVTSNLATLWDLCRVSGLDAGFLPGDLPEPAAGSIG